MLSLAQLFSGSDGSTFDRELGGAGLIDRSDNAATPSTDLVRAFERNCA
jgi:hypothetical protein